MPSRQQICIGIDEVQAISRDDKYLQGSYTQDWAGSLPGDTNDGQL
jgi:hypothetical protein